MVSPVLYEHYYDGAFLISEEEQHRSRDNGVISNAGTTDLPLDAGLVLAHAAGAVTALAKPSGNTGNGTVGSLSAGIGAQVGVYQVRFTGATSFNVYDPNNARLGTGATGTPFADEVNFTITAGGTAFAAGDAFAVIVADGGWAPYVASTPPVDLGILYNRIVVPAQGSRKATVIARQAQVNQEELVWDPSIGAAGDITSAAGTNTGNGTIGSLSIISSGTLTGGVDPFVPAGVYTLTALDSTDFAVADPTGKDLPLAEVGAAYAEEIGFTITQGSTVFAEGDSFTVTVTESGQTQALAALAAAGIIAR
jgi:hypothetical protein